MMNRYPTLRDFCDEDFWKWANLEYATSRNYLKNCGKPKDWYDLWLIDFHKKTCAVFKRFA